MKMRILALTLVCLLWSLMPVSAQDADGDQLVAFTIANESDETICYVYISAPTSDYWGDDWLGASEMLSPGDSRTWELEPSTYDVLLEDCGENTLLERYELDVFQPYRLNFAGRDASIDAWDLLAEGVRLYESGEYENALDAYKDALSAAADVGDLEVLEHVLHNMGAAYWAQGANLLAVDYYTQALAIAKKLGDYVMQADTLNGLGIAYGDLEQFSEALDSLQQALAIERQIGYQRLETVTLYSIGTIHDMRWELDDSLHYYMQSLDVAREIGSRVDEFDALSIIGIVHWWRGEYVKALEYGMQALEVARVLDDPANEGDTLTRIGNVYESWGQYTEAAEYYDQALTLARETDNRYMEGTALLRLAALNIIHGNYGEALILCQETIAIARQIGSLEMEDASLSHLGGIYHAQGLYTEAVQYYSQSLAIARQLGDRDGESAGLRNIGGIYHDQGETEEALTYYEEALLITREIGERAGEASLLNMIAQVYSDYNRYDDAEAYSQQALAIQREIGDRSSESTTLNSLAILYHRQGKDAVALDYWQQALDIVHTLDMRTAEIVFLGNRARLYAEQGHLEQATTDLRAAVDLVEEIIADAALDEMIAALLDERQYGTPYQRLAVLLTEQEDLESALDYAERGRSVLARTYLSTSISDFHVNLDGELLEEEARLRLAINEAQNLLDSLYQDVSATNLDIQNAQAVLDNARRAYDEHQRLMQLQGGFLARQITYETASLEQIQAILPDDTTLLAYTLSDPESVVFLITNDDLAAWHLDVSGVEIEEIVDAFLLDRRTNVDALRTLYDLIFEPITVDITTSHLIIVPDGALHYVPFAALPSGEGRYLIDDYTISTVSSATALVLLHERSQGATADSTYQGLVLAESSAPGMSVLRYADQEANAISALLGVTATLDATETDLQRYAAGNATLHISAHAQLDPFAPLFSTIHLRADDTNDGRLDVREIYGLDLTQGTELVTLSGCETGLGGSGEDFGVLTQAFFAAGTPRIVASLWSIDDQATADLLTTFYRERENHDTDADALRTAMLATREQYPEPYYWASFVLSGLP